jgi:peptide deformylase
MENTILLVAHKADAKFLHKRTKSFTLSAKGEFVVDGKTFNRAAMTELVRRMRQAMQRANGIGLSANQIGLPYRIFVARVPDDTGSYKLYTVVNPEIEKLGAEKVLLEEGCLSVPGRYGRVSRATQLTVRGLDRNGHPLKFKAWGLLAHVFQHEIDHLDGVVFIDKAKDVHEVPTSVNNSNSKNQSAK